MFRSKRKFDVLLIGGASGTGKSHISYLLAKYYKINVVQVDDFQCIVENITKEIDFPVFHYWKNHFEEAIKLPMEKKLEIMINYANELSVVLVPVIENHLEENRPMILEGDFISPDLCKKLLSNNTIRDRIKCIFITEDEKKQIIENYNKRERSLQEDRAELSWRYNNWLKEQVYNTEINLVSSRPWNKTLKRIKKVLDTKKITLP